MPRVTFRSHDGQDRVLDVPLGHSLMEAAVGAGLAGIVAECGGAMMCATCHVHVDPDRLADLPPLGPTEDAMLDSAICPRQPNSRLSCQLVADAGFDGLVVTMPERQR
jgi:ferredoxin, 2Fe-2S